MKCINCGAELSDDAKFCSYCGYKVVIAPSSIEEENKIPCVTYVEELPDEATESRTSDIPKSFGEKIKTKAVEIWDNLSGYGKVATIAITVFALLFLIARLASKTAPIVIAVVQIIIAVVSILMHKDVIKLDSRKKWIKWLVLILAIALSVLNVWSYSWGKTKTPGVTNTPLESGTNSTPSTTPKVVMVEAPYNAEECVGEDYSAIKKSFIDAGFNSVKTKAVEDLEASESERLNQIESVSINGKTDFAVGDEFSENDDVIISYHVYRKYSVAIHVDFVENWIFSTYDVTLFINDTKKDTMSHGKDADFEFQLEPGTYTIKFAKKEDSSVNGEVEIVVDCDINASYKINCYSDEVSVKTIYVDRLVDLADNEVKMDVDAYDYKYKDFKEVESELSALGFTNIQYEILYDIVWGWTDEGEVQSVSIDGNIDFSRGDIFKKDASIIITYHLKEDDDPNKQTEATKPSTSEATTPAKKYDLDKNLYVAQCTQDSDKTTMYRITFADCDANGNYTTFYTFDNIINPRAMGDEFNAIGPLPSWFYVGALVHVQANLSGGVIKTSGCTVTQATKTETDTTIAMPIMEGSSLDSIATVAKNYGLSAQYSDEDWGNGSKMRGLSNNKFAIKIVYSTNTKEVLMVSIVSYAANTTTQEQKDFIKAIASVACPAADSSSVSQWVNSNVGTANSTEINGRTYELLLGPSSNLCYSAGVSEWEAWDLAVN